MSTVYRLILPDWAKAMRATCPKVLEGQLSDEELVKHNLNAYNVYYLPNSPSHYEAGRPTEGYDIDTFQWVFVDMDLKDGVYKSKEDFLGCFDKTLPPTKVVDSGHGIHLYWRVSDLDAMSYLRIQRRLARHMNTDLAVGKIHQLMRVPGFANTKNEGEYELCQVLEESDGVYTCEQFDKWLSRLSKEDETYCQQHYDKTYRTGATNTEVKEDLPPKFGALLKNNEEVKQLFAGDNGDRSVADFRLAHILYAEGYTREEAASVLVNCRKALDRSPANRIAYAINMIDKIWTFEANQDVALLSNSVADILKKTDASQGERFPCWHVFDGTNHGFRLSEVLGLIGGSGSGKTTLALNYFLHFALRKPEYIHLFVSLEQPEREIALRWARLVGDNQNLNDKVHVLGNYNEDGSYRNLSLKEIEAYVLTLEKRLGVKVGCLVIDHIGALKKDSKNGEGQGLIGVCLQMKAVATRTNTFMIMQSQTSRAKAGIGDVELDKDAAYGTTFFEWFCDYVVTTWQPLKRVYDQAPHMTITAYKYCKIRHKNTLLDRLKEDVIYALKFDPNSERLQEMSQRDETAYEHYNKMATILINKDRKREPNKITKIDWTEADQNGNTQSHQD